MFDVNRELLQSDHAIIDIKFRCNIDIGNIIRRASQLGRYEVPSRSDTKKAIPYSCIDRELFVSELEPPNCGELRRSLLTL